MLKIQEQEKDKFIVMMENKYYYNFREKKFTSAPGKVNELLKRKDVQEAIKKGEQYLGL